jgi:hypothetical protein
LLGLANALTAVIMGSKSAGVAFEQFGMQMLTSFISSIIEAILWAEIAVPILTALGVLSGGATTAPGSGITIAAVAAGMSGVQGLIGHHAQGGLISGPGSGTSDSIPAMLSHGEFVMPASIVSQYGPRFMEMLRQGKLENLDARAIANLTRPITSDPRAYQQMMKDGAGAGGAGGGGGTTVEGHKVSVIIPRDRQDILDVLKSAEGEKHIVDTARRRRVDIGIGT